MEKGGGGRKSLPVSSRKEGDKRKQSGPRVGQNETRTLSLKEEKRQRACVYREPKQQHRLTGNGAFF